MVGQQPNKVTAFFVARILAEVGFIIALPLTLMIFFGHWLDDKLGIKAIFIFVGMFVALAFSTYSLYQKIKKLPN